jgi:hypothetical protein
MMRVLVGLVALAGSGLAFPFAAKQEGIKNGHIIRRQQVCTSIPNFVISKYCNYDS